ncbi:uncharacterized protein LOC130675455 isoform X2 [Microplitis mediator]|uniref:uncharacterized protein LOC130675455 isoform X2 n=1 Tax=Microplitis mediator TaxID=375433 RepID=UPI0025536620|nr:uncharacterized protein LOC130675455 isoform X2 [Microplitis mediator]
MDGILFSHACEVIFENTIDPIILEKLKRVHILWKISIDKILETTDIWKRACLNEIASEPISGMITRLCPTLSFKNYHELDDPKVWRTVYISYRKWMILSKLRDFYITATRPISTEIEKFASCEKYFAIETKRGTIDVFDINHLDEPVDTIRLKISMNDIRFWYPGTGDVFLVAISKYDVIRFFNVSTNVNQVPCINDKKPRASILCTSTVNTLFTMIGENLIQYKYNTEDGLIQYKTGRISGYCRKLFSEKNELICLTLEGKSLTLKHYQIPTSDEYNDMLPEKSIPVYPPNRNTLKFSWSMESIFDFLTSNVILHKSTDGYCYLIIDDHQTNWNIHYPFQKFGSENLVTSGILHGKILILGFETENIEQLKNSELDLNSGIEHRVCNRRIQWLQIAEAQEKLIIIATTDVKIYFINFILENRDTK